MLYLAQDMLKKLQDRVSSTVNAALDLAETVPLPAPVKSILQNIERRPESEENALLTASPMTVTPTPTEPYTPTPVTDTSLDSRGYSPASPNTSPAEPKISSAQVNDSTAQPHIPTTQPNEFKAKTNIQETNTSGGSAPLGAPWVQDAQLAQTEPTPLTGASLSQPPQAQPSQTKQDQKSPRGRRRVSGKKRGLVVNKDLSGIVKMLDARDTIDGSTYLARILWSLGIADLEGLGPLRPADMARMIMSRSPVSLEPPNVARYIRRSQPSCISIAKSEGVSNYYELNDEGRKIFEEHFKIN